MNIIFLVLGISYILVLTFLSTFSVGKLPETEIFTWQLPVAVFICFSLPFVLGLLAGKK